MKRVLLVALAWLMLVLPVAAQWQVPQYSVPIGRGSGTGFSSALCTSAQLLVGQSAAAPICRTLTGDVTINASGVTAIGATKVTNAMLNADVFSTAHTWSAAQSLVINQNAGTFDTVSNNSTGTAATAYSSYTNSAASANFGIAGTGYTTFSVLTGKAFVYASSASSGIGVFADGALPIDFYVSGTRAGGFTSGGLFTLTTPLAAASGGTGLSALGTGIASWLATPSSANLATAVTDETGSGALVFASSPALTTPSLGVATATSINKVAITAPATSATLTIPDGVTLTGPASSGTAMTLGNAETVTGVKTFGSSGAVGRLRVAGTTSGSTILDAAATASGTLTLPATTDTLLGKATTDTLTNKTFDTAGTGNSFSINGLAATANTGTGSVVRATSPTLVTPTLGVATATSLNGNFFTAGTYTLAGAASKTFTFSNTLTVAGTDGTTITFQGTDTYVGRTTTDTLTNKTLTSPAISGPTVTGTADVQQAVSLSGDISPAQLTANTNDWAPTGFSTASAIRFSTDASRNITGLAGGADGRIVILHNIGAQNAVLINNSGSSSAGNKFLIGGDITLAADTSITLRYDATSTAWRAITTPGSGGGGGGGVTSATIAAGTGISVTGTCTITTSGTCTVANTGVTSVSGAGLATGTVTTTGNITVTAATQSDQETATSTSTAVAPGRQQYHPSAAKAWGLLTSTAGITSSYNVASATNPGTGNYTVTFSTAFSTANYACVGSGAAASVFYTTSKTTTTVSYNIVGVTTGSGTAQAHQIVCYGDQ